MEYVEFGFKNFKGISDMTFPLTGSVTTLIGLNESGKTTVLEAIFCFSYGAENLDVLDPNMASIREPETWIPIAQRANFNDPIEITATVRLSASDQAHYREHMRKKHGLRLTEVPDSVKITERYHFENSRYVAKKTQKLWSFKISAIKGQQKKPRVYDAKDTEWHDAVEYLKSRLPRIYYFPNFLFELPDRFALEDIEKATLSEDADKSRFYRSTFEQILSQLGVGANLQTHVVERLKSSEKADQRNLGSVLLEMSRVVTRTVFEGWSMIFGRAPAAQEVELAADTGEDGNAYLELKIKSPDGYYDLSERSLGFRWFFMFLLMTSYRGLSEAEKGVVFLLDEPASNLHSSAQAALLNSFEKLAETCSLVYTTHSHHMINIRWLDSAYVVKNEALGDFRLEEYLMSRTAVRTSISATPYRRFVADNPSQTSYFQPVLDLLEYRPSDLEPIPDVVLVEGKSDFYILRYCIDVLQMPTSLHLVPGGGAGSLDPLIRLHIGWAKSFVVLLDGDAEGKKQRKRYENEFGPFLAERCLLVPEACGDEAAAEVEDLLSDADRVVLLDAVFPPGEPRPHKKKAIAKAAAELYARGEPVALGSATTARIQTLFDALQQALQKQAT